MVARRRLRRRRASGDAPHLAPLGALSGNSSTSPNPTRRLGLPGGSRFAPRSSDRTHDVVRRMRSLVLSMSLRCVVRQSFLNTGSPDTETAAPESAPGATPPVRRRKRRNGAPGDRFQDRRLRPLGHPPGASLARSLRQQPDGGVSV